jgi:hypothetical protein
MTQRALQIPSISNGITESQLKGLMIANPLGQLLQKENRKYWRGKSGTLMN